MEVEHLKDLVVEALDDLKARDVMVIDVRAKTAITDIMVIASGTSDRHVRALTDTVIMKCKDAHIIPLGVEGQGDCEWVLVDLCDVVVHLMLPPVRNYYKLEKLWSVDYTPSQVNS